MKKKKYLQKRLMVSGICALFLKVGYDCNWGREQGSGSKGANDLLVLLLLLLIHSPPLLPIFQPRGPNPSLEGQILVIEQILVGVR